MTPKQTSREGAQNWMAAEAFVSTASNGAGETARPALTAARRVASKSADTQETISPGAAARPGSVLADVCAGGELTSGDAALNSLAHGLDLSDVRLEKVLRLRQAIASGEYRVSAADVADRLIGAFTSGPEPNGRS